jgi:hypothetical protein
MKRVAVLFLALMLMLTGCAGKEKERNASVEDVCCPYEINHKKEAVELTLQDGRKSGVLWHVETVPEDVCQVTQEELNGEYTCRYRLSGKVEGAAQLIFTAVQPDQTPCFVLELVVNVDSDGKTVVSSYQHHERKENVVEAEGLHYKWNVDVNGILNFSFINREDNWSVQGDGGDVFVLSNMMSTPTGCKFSAQAIATGKTTINLVSENTQRRVQVVLQADDQGKMEVISVQEQ